MAEKFITRSEVYALLGVSDGEAHEQRMRDVPAGTFVRDSDRSAENFCGHTEREHQRLFDIAVEAMQTMANDPSVSKLSTEFKLQDLEADYITIEGVPVIRTRHALYPNSPLNFSDADLN
jgi:hypothetical protein